MKKSNILKEYLLVVLLTAITIGVFYFYPQKSALFEKISLVTLRRC